ncbi:primosomal protein N' [uncultured Muribaculum sp.]|uniref:replication restart helicase PriA n=1 Tax=uncultured Muribaculum sp. TaxID=1918613 RepID=UPI0025B7A0C0|nr:primosomal protein N' [uncultured Muribaculum sp.]
MPSKARLYAEVILPLPLFGTFTYSIPTTLEGKAAVGHRVIVPFGRKKYYTGIIESITPVAPEGFEVKDISSVLDPWPVVKHPQLKLWEWIAEYYLCTAGDVYKAAVPAGLKVESETFIELNPDYEEMPDARMTDREAIIMQSLDHNGKMTPAEISKKTGLNSIESTISSMVERRMLIIAEKLIERYRPKKETLVRLAVDRNDNEAMHKVFDAVKGAKKPEVPRQHLLEQSGLSPAILAALASKGIVEIFTREINRFNYTGTEQGELPKLSAPQSEALDSIHRMFIDKNVTLLHGVTSSGKTEIYIHLIDYILKKGSQALYLVPEIALTTQLTRRLQKVFGKRVIIYHSKFSDNERVDIWKRMLHDPSPCVVIGARSSLFLPFSRLGLVIVDEEHESSYKQFDPAPRYNARDCAIVLASMHGAKTLLGSATPAIETYYKALNGRYGLVTLSERYEGVQLPLIEIVDLNDERRRGRISGPMSARLAMMSREAVKGGEQVILFHNRRGFAPVVVCKQCGYVPKCQNCDVSLTYHRKAGEMVCHYCGATYKLPTICPACKEPAIEVYGYGTERIEEIAESSFPGARIMRMDLDTTRNKDSYLNIINDFSLGKADILVGTQMVTKGLDFERVSLVGILNADNLINFPDFRASERAFNMLEQVAGRAGRRNKRGLVIVQTSQPAHPILSYLQAHNYEGFYEHELEERRRYGYPPFTRVINIYLKHRDEDLLIRAAAGYAETLRHLFGNRILGPDEPHIARIQSLYIRKIMLKVEIQASMSKVKAILRSVYEAQMADKSLRSLVVYYDVDPM